VQNDGAGTGGAELRSIEWIGEERERRNVSRREGAHGRDASLRGTVQAKLEALRELPEGRGHRPQGRTPDRAP
jgi:hypothetical protein